MEFRGLKAQYQRYKHEIDNAMEKVMLRGDFIEGDEVRLLERRLAEYVGVKHCITCANGTDAMSLIMMAWDIKPGDAVFIPDFTFFATGEIVALCGATPIFVDVDKDTFNIDPIKLETEIQRVIAEGQLIPKVIIAVDLFGLPANYIDVTKVASKYNLKILEDAAQGFGGSIHDKKAGSFGDAATTSFFPAKPLGCYGDGGAIFTNDDILANVINSLKVHGRGETKYDNVRIGLNSRLDTIQAAILNIKLTKFIEFEFDSVNHIHELYSNKLNGIVEVPVIPKNYSSSFAQYTIKLKDEKTRNRVQGFLLENNIPSMVYYSKPLHKQTAFSSVSINVQNLRVSSELSQTVLSIPMHPYLTFKDVEKVSTIIIAAINMN